jgi:hypothetical protein
MPHLLCICLHGIPQIAILNVLLIVLARVK